MIHKALERQNCPALRAGVDANGGEEVVWECPWGGDHVLGRVEDGYLKTADVQEAHDRAVLFLNNVIEKNERKEIRSES